MKNMPRIYLDQWLFSIDIENQRLVQEGNAINVIPFSKLQKSDGYYRTSLDAQTGETEDVMSPDGKTVIIPEAILHSGYDEGSEFASAFNRFETAMNVKLIDADSLKELTNKPMFNSNLPVIDIHGTSFEVDVAYGELREKGNPYNVIELDFLDYDKENASYQFLFDPVSKNIQFEGNYPMVSIPEMVILAPSAVAQKHGLSVSDLPEHDYLLRNNQQVLNSRILGYELPSVKLMDEEYKVNLYEMRLEAVSEPGKVIELRKNITADKFEFYYDCRSKRPVNIPDNAIAFPDGVVLVHLPAEKYLDPVGFGQLQERDISVYLSSCVQQSQIEARVYPFNQSAAAKKIEQNMHRQRNRMDSVRQLRDGLRRQRRNRL